MRLPLVAVVGGIDRVPESALTALRQAWRFARYANAEDVLSGGEAPDVVVLASAGSRSGATIQALRQRAQPRAVLVGFGEDSSEDMGALSAAEGWVRLPVTAQSLSDRLAKVHPQRADAAVPISLPGNPPRQLGPFTLIHRLGVGSFGAVYAAQDTRTGESRALKIAHPEVLADLESRGRWQRETALLKDVQIPGVVKIHGSGELSGFLCLVMDLLPGRSLHDHVTRLGPLAIELVTAMGERLGRALNALHALGVIHRDVKPGNVVIDPRGGSASLVDLGLVRHVRSQQLTASDVLLGTAGYLSPERIQGGSGDAASDSYALAATLFFALTGRAPFKDKTAMDLIRRVSTGAPADPIRSLRLDIPHGLADLLDGMLLPQLAARAPLTDLVEWCFRANGGATR